MAIRFPSGPWFSWNSPFDRRKLGFGIFVRGELHGGRDASACRAKASGERSARTERLRHPAGAARADAFEDARASQRILRRTTDRANGVGADLHGLDSV